MRPAALYIGAVLLTLPALGQSAGKTGVVNLSKAIAECADGRSAATRLRRQFEPSQSHLENAEAQIKADRAKLEQHSNRRIWWCPFRHRLGAKAKSRRLAAIVQRERQLVREREDLRGIFERERNRAVNDITGRLKLVVARYSAEQGYSEIRITGGIPAAEEATYEDVTDRVVALYNQVYPSSP